MADHTQPFRWIVLMKENLEQLFANDPQVFVAGNLLWYPVEGHPEIRVAPDVLVVFGRPKGDRGSLGIQFVWSEESLEIYRPDGNKFLTSVEFAQHLEQEQQRADRLANKLRELGLNPDEI
ncbi:MAG: hypothetical protein GVY17_10310 [Cyanobacteria bacterium]|jgi:Uma2 family endonuclease|nr:hypothetical protein [Cyanobacteria bacterium GSL.Bin21]